MEKQFYDLYINSLEMAMTKEDTVKSIKTSLNNLYNYANEHFDFKDEQDMLTHLSAINVQAMFKDFSVKYKPSSINQKQQLLRNFYSYLMNCGQLDVKYNPFLAVKKISTVIVKKEAKIKDVLTLEEITKILAKTYDKTLYKHECDYEFLSKRNRLIIALLSSYGNRIEELNKTVMSDIKYTSFGTKYIYISPLRVKNSLEKKLYLGNKLLQYFDEYMEIRNKVVDSDYLLCSTTGNKLNGDYTNAFIKNLIKKCNIDKEHVTNHSFRSSTAIILQNRGLTPYEISMLCGWKLNDKEFDIQRHYLNHEDKDTVDKILNYINFL